MAVILTKAQAKWVAWALDPMGDFWCTKEGAHERGGDVLDESCLPRLDGLDLILSDNDEVNSDLLYRMEVQAVDISQDAGEFSRAASANRVALKIREHRPALAHTDIGGGWI